jgi:N utilization substance protein A
MNKELIAIFEYLEREKGIKRDVIIKAIEESLTIAARKKNKGVNNVIVEVNPKTGSIVAIAHKEVVDHVEYPEEEILLKDAQALDPKVKVGDWIDIEVTPEDFGRIAAQTARQVISQKLRGAEKEVIYEEFRHRAGELISGSIRRISKGGTLIVDLGKVEALMPTRFYPKGENYAVGDKVLALLLEVQDTETGGAEVILSRSHPDFVLALLQQEVPELAEGVIQIRKIVRDAGFRTKIALVSSDPKLDPVGACVGVRGGRIKNVLRELGHEKIDLFPWSDNPIQLIKNALSPSEIRRIDETEEGDYVIVVADESYPSALGRRGANARLTADLLERRIEIFKESEFERGAFEEQRRLALSEDPILDSPLTDLHGVNQLVIDAYIQNGLDTLRKILQKNAAEISRETGLSIEIVEDTIDRIRKHVGSSIG